MSTNCLSNVDVRGIKVWRAGLKTQPDITEIKYSLIIEIWCIENKGSPVIKLKGKCHV